MVSSNLCDLLLVSIGRLRPCGFWLQRIHYEFVNLFGGRGEWWGTMGSTVGWVVAWYYLKPFNKTGDSLAACLLQLQWLNFVWINFILPATPPAVVQQYFWLSLLNYCSGQRQKSVAGVLFIVSDLPPSCLGWPGLPPQIALSRPDICQIHSRRIICLKVSIQHW